MARGVTQAVCPQCRAENPEGTEACFRCGRALFALVQGSVLADRYEIQRPVGQGGMGRVYQAHDRILDEGVALKVLRPELTRDRELLARFRSEIKLARRVTHRNVCRIHEYSENGRLRFISMEYIEGVNLREYLRGRAVGTEEAFEISLQMGRGLEAVHELGILHRDFKAANIMVDTRGVVKLMDFGIAKQLAAEAEGITTTGHVMGTPEYMSPEQARGDRVDLRSDLYALGCVVYEVFTGVGLFHGDNAAATLYKHLHEPPPLETPGLPGPLIPVLGRVLAKTPAERYRHVGEFLEALESARAAAGFRDPGSRSLLLPLPVPPQLRTAASSPPSPLPPWPSPPTPEKGGVFSSPTRALTRPPAMPGMAKAAMLMMVVLVLALAFAFWPRHRGAPAPSPLARPSEVPRGDPTAPPSVAPAEAAPDAGPTPAPEPAHRASSPTPRPPLAGATPRPEATAPPVRVAAPLAPAGPVETNPAPRPSPAGPSPAAAGATTTTGTLSLLIVPPAEVTVDAAELGLVSSREVPLAPGRHVVRVQHPDYEVLPRVVRIRAGETERLVLDLAEKAIRKEHP